MMELKAAVCAHLAFTSLHIIPPAANHAQQEQTQQEIQQQIMMLLTTAAVHLARCWQAWLQLAAAVQPPLAV